MTPRRELALTVLGCLAGAGLALFSATRTWSAELIPRPQPLPAQRVTQTGGPLPSALAVAALAGAGALLATRGAGRLAVGVLLMLSGVGITVGGARGLPGAWPALCVAGGVAVLAAGAATVVRGRGWLSMGTRYERATAPDAPSRTGRPSTGKDLWDALDRGEDPTVER
jgi:hypothetical protein